MSTFAAIPPQHIWWHTALHTLASFLLLIPLLFVVSIVYHMGFSYYGEDAANDGFIIHGIECAIASFLTIAVPRRFLRKSHILVTATIFATVCVVLFCPVILFQFKLGFEGVGVFDVIDLIACVVGLVAGAVSAVASSDEFLKSMQT